MHSKKILYTATTAIHIMNFHLPYLQWFKKMGYEVHVACNGNASIPFVDKIFNVPFARNPLDKKNREAYYQLKKYIAGNHYDIIHCHTPMGGIVTRLAAISARKKGTKVLYTAHGFHFYKGAPLKNWLLFFPIEWVFSRITDAIITINEEDFKILKDKKFLIKNSYKTNGIGINPGRLKIEKYKDTFEIRKSLGYEEDDFIILYIAEFTPGKNHQFIFEAIPQIIKKIPKAKFLFLGGKAKLGDKMIAYAKRHSFEQHINVLGYQTEIGKFISIADVGISASLREGLPIGIAEIMSTGLPVVISKIRGHNELVIDGENGFLFGKNSQTEFIEAIEKLYINPKLRRYIGVKGTHFVKRFIIDVPLQQTIEIYKKFLS